ncbi:MAG: hypothetical protein Q9191_006198 [Dirinaria sp. TL-2023a]
MYPLTNILLFALTVSARCTRREASNAQQQSPEKLALLPANNNLTTPPSLNNEGGAGSPTPTTTASNSSGAVGCPPLMKAVAFNGGMNAGMFDTIAAAQDWLTFSPSIPGPPASPHAAAGFVPMMAFASDVPTAINLINSPNPPAWLLTFNEPDYSYMGSTPTMSPSEAASAIAPLISAAAGKQTTKLVAPVTADPMNPWLDQFYAACNCKAFFSAYNIHQYHPTSAEVIDNINSFRAKFSDKPLWVTEVAPGGSGCTTSWDEAGQFMKEIYAFAKGSGFIDRVFWNTGNEIGGGDQNVCNSYLLDTSGNPSPLLPMYQAIDCSSS